MAHRALWAARPRTRCEGLFGGHVCRIQTTHKIHRCHECGSPATDEHGDPLPETDQPALSGPIREDLMAEPIALNPECQQGKHDNCDGNALHPDDTIGPCECPHHTSEREPAADLVGRLRASVDAARERRLADGKAAYPLPRRADPATCTHTVVEYDDRGRGTCRLCWQPVPGLRE